MVRAICNVSLNGPGHLQRIVKWAGPSSLFWAHRPILCTVLSSFPFKNCSLYSPPPPFLFRYLRFLSPASRAQPNNGNDTLTPSREHLFFMAKVAEEAERFDEMVEFMEQLVSVADTDELTTDERNLLATAYKNAIDSRRKSWWIVDGIQKGEEIRGNEHRANELRSFVSKVESELSSICDGVLNLLNSKLLSAAYSKGYDVFYLNMKGDYNRYLAEFKSGLEREEVAEKARSAYRDAQVIAEGEMSPAHPIRLGLAISFSVFYMEILDSPDIAINLAEQALYEATIEADLLGNSLNTDSALLMQILRDHLTSWTVHTQEDGVEKPEKVAQPRDED